jgi:hypothetical protein
MDYIMLPQDRNPYYDSARDKPDRSEFASLRMSMQDKRQPSSAGAWVRVVFGLVAVIAIAIIAKRLWLA